LGNVPRCRAPILGALCEINTRWEANGGPWRRRPNCAVAAQEPNWTCLVERKGAPSRPTPQKGTGPSPRKGREVPPRPTAGTDASPRLTLWGVSLLARRLREGPRVRDKGPGSAEGPGHSSRHTKVWGPHHDSIPKYRRWHPLMSRVGCDQASQKPYDRNSVGQDGTDRATKEVGGHTAGHASCRKDMEHHGWALLPRWQDGMGDDTSQRPPSLGPAYNGKLSHFKDRPHFSLSL
jgi:hypothetical protein